MKGTERMLIWIIFVCVLCAEFRNVNALSCLSCDAIGHPRICSQVTECFPGEKCGMETFINEDGFMVYKLGCVDSNTCGLLDTIGRTTPDYGNQFYSCHECCDDTDLCNVHGCNSTGYPVDRGPICYSCGTQFEGTPCHHIEHCEVHEVCYNEVTLEFQTDRLVTSGCRSKHHCAGQTLDPLIGIGKRTTHICSDCCQADLCNLQCENVDICSDDDKCSLLMSNYDVCKSPDVALEFCKKTCGLCPDTDSATCNDTRFDCQNIHKYVDICSSQPEAKSYGCLDFCGYCSDVSTNPHYTHTTPTFPSYTHSTPVFPPGTTTARRVLFHEGDHVVRGPDWSGGNQDGDGPGTVTGIHLDNSSTILPGMVQVLWYITNITESYKVGANGTFELMQYNGPFPPIKPPIAPSGKNTSIPATISNGDLVERGPDWTDGEVDSNSTGTVIDISKAGWITVMWNTDNSTGVYRYGDNGTYEVQIVSMVTSSKTSSTTTLPMTTTYDPYNFHVGDRVIRGPGWMYGSQDGNGPGTVTDTSIPNWIGVRWDASMSLANKYRNGFGGVHDIIRIPPPTTTTIKPTPITTTTTTPPTTRTTQITTTTTPITTTTNDPTTTTTPSTTTPSTTMPPTTTPSMTTPSITTPTTTTPPPTAGVALSNEMYVGASVQRGRDWRYGTQDGHGSGRVIEILANGWVKVQWDTTGYLNTYRLGAENAFDILFSPGTYNPPVSGR